MRISECIFLNVFFLSLSVAQAREDGPHFFWEFRTPLVSPLLWVPVKWNNNKNHFLIAFFFACWDRDWMMIILGIMWNVYGRNTTSIWRCIRVYVRFNHGLKLRFTYNTNANHVFQFSHSFIHSNIFVFQQRKEYYGTLEMGFYRITSQKLKKNYVSRIKFWKLFPHRNQIERKSDDWSYIKILTLMVGFLIR